MIFSIFFNNYIKLQFYNFSNNCFEIKIYYLFNLYIKNFKFTLFKMCKLIVFN